MHQLKKHWKRLHRVAQPIVPLPIPDNTPEGWLPVYWREVDVTLDNLVSEAQPQKEYAPVIKSAPFNSIQHDSSNGQGFN